MSQDEISRLETKLDTIIERIDEYHERLTRVEERHNACKEITAKRLDDLTERPLKQSNAVSRWIGIIGGALGIGGAVFAYWNKMNGGNTP